jgi:hypothetical protein
VKPNDRVRIVHDGASYTAGCYQDETGTIEQVREVPLAGAPPLVLYFVTVDCFPRDDHLYGGWWFQRSELQEVS